MQSIIKKISLILLSACCSLSLQAAESQWLTLIDGATGMENFSVVGSANWSASDGALQATEGSGTSFLLTNDSFADFELHIEFWVSEDANSGIYMRCQDITGITDRNCYEANIYDQRPDLTFGTGGIVHVGPVSEPFPKVGGQWNTYHITLNGSSLVVNLNGEETVNVMDEQFAQGPIALQWARGTVRFRAMRIRPL